MPDLLIDLLPVIVGAAVVPLYPIMILFLLQSKNGLLKATAFVVGAISMRLVQGVLAGLLFGTANESGSGIIASTLLLVVGILLLIAAFKKWRKEEDPDDPPPQWMTTISELSALKAMGAGALFVTVAVKQWVFTLSAISIISAAELDRGASVGFYLFYILVVQTFGLLPILMYAIAPQQSAGPLNAAKSWLTRHNRVIVVAVSLIFGVLFLFKGVTGLIG